MSVVPCGLLRAKAGTEGRPHSGVSGPHTPVWQLTSRQREVLQLVAEGRSAKEVAALLGISTRTAEAHKARILETLGLRTTAELVQYAIRNGIVSV